MTILVSCKSKQTIELNVDGISHSGSDTYRAPSFITDDRIDKIKKIGPELHKLMEQYAKDNNIPGISYGIVVDKVLILSDGVGFVNLESNSQATPESSFRIASMTKSFTAMAILKLRDEGKLDLNDPVSQYIPEMSSLVYLTGDAPSIDIENLLTMTAGFPEDNPWGDRQLDETDQMLIGLIADGLSFANPPSYTFEYSNTGYALLGHIISKVSGIPYQVYINKNILHPLGMNQTYWEYDLVPQEQLALGYRWDNNKWKLEPMLHDGAFGAMGGLITSINDFSKYVSFHLSAWPPRSDEDKGPIKRSSLREMQTAQFASLNASSTDFNGALCTSISGYGFGLGITTYCNDLKQVGHGGALPGFGSNYRFYPEYGIGLMAFCNLTYTTPWPFKEIGKLLFESLELKPRTLPVSGILTERKNQIAQLIQKWDGDLESKILAENFYLDMSREDRILETQNILDKAGAVKSIDEIVPNNQLRGRFKIQAEKGEIDIFFTLTPEKLAKVQQLDISFKPTKVK